MPEISLTLPTDRRSDVELKQDQVADLLRGTGCDGLLVMQPENIAWLTAGAAPRGILDPEAYPLLYYSAEGRWLVASNVDTQRVFDEEIDGLGFQLKEWPWHWGRAQLLADLTQGRNLAADQPCEGCKLVAAELAQLRRSLTQYEMACLRALGQILSHSLEATGRTMNRGESEREIAGQIAHRLLHRGTYPVQIAVAADGRSRSYRQFAFTSAPINHYCVMTVTARKYGLCARASRAVAFDEAEPLFRREYDAACKISATYVAGSWPDSVPRAILASGQRIYQLVGAEHDFYLAPQGHVIGRAPVEQTFTPQDEDLLQPNWAVCWHPSVGAAVCCDTFLLSDDGPRAVTPCENWPLKRIRIQGSEFVRPDLLVRS
jgi:hypothetical protein